ncbi:MAG: SGNH/GDSL hydrolase family protein [Spirochaetota bacterium]
MIKPVNTIEKLVQGQCVTIVALGDSLTYGWMVDKGYIDYFYDFLKSYYSAALIKIINKGIPGDTADGGLHRVSYDVISYNPDCVLIQFALNDYACGYSPHVFGNYIRAIINAIQAKLSSDIVLVTSVWFGDFPEATQAYKLYDTIVSIADEYKLPVSKTHEYWKNAINKGTPLKELVQIDGVHPTEEGYYIMSRALRDLFS